ncbi:hypothetical protein, partial [Neisseria sp. P0019.S002]|uniref:hypothetical protein n=1 Tax=Neisseria sp. P0019.S002 TaxID=3436798 RepID=UPI003F80D5AB
LWWGLGSWCDGRVCSFAAVLAGGVLFVVLGGVWGGVVGLFLLGMVWLVWFCWLFWCRCGVLGLGCWFVVFVCFWFLCGLGVFVWCFWSGWVFRLFW